MPFVPTIFPAILPAIIMARQRRRILSKFEAVGASDPACARTPSELGVRDTHLFGRLVKAGVLVAAGDDRYFLCAEGRARWRRRRLRAVLVATAVALAVALTVFLLVRSRAG